jgi:serine/threonine protein kinase
MLVNPKYINEVNNEFVHQQIKNGNNPYVAPEVLEAFTGYNVNESEYMISSQIDLFSLGVCLYYMIFLKFPYRDIRKSKVNSKYIY